MYFGENDEKQTNKLRRNKRINRQEMKSKPMLQCLSEADLTLEASALLINCQGTKAMDLTPLVTDCQ
jgi:hypothetical protein